ncbi:Uncharacterised protein [uncultured archaeon]|nr:Uncharacterised protein [uncultured archaeon]
MLLHRRKANTIQQRNRKRNPHNHIRLCQTRKLRANKHMQADGTALQQHHRVPLRHMPAKHNATNNKHDDYGRTGDSERHTNAFNGS